jgi:hypothetical protein
MRLPLAVAAVVVGLGVFAAGSVFAQSLGDVARQQKQNSAQSKPAPKKVITEDDLPTQESISTGSSDAKATDTSKEVKQGDSTADKMKSADDFKAAIQTQKQNVDSLQKQVDDMKASVHFVEANRYSNGVQYNEHQIQKQKEADRMQKQLDEEKSRLQDMQEQARKAGFGSAVYE